MLNFKPIEPEDYQWLHPLLQESGYKTSPYSFVTLYMWSKVYNTQVAAVGENHAVARSEKDGIMMYLYPAGRGEEREALEAVIEDMRSHGKPSLLYSVSEDAKQRLEQWYPHLFELQAVRDDFEYIYDRQELADLPGKKFQKKRNHVSRFVRENPDWEFHPLTKESLPVVREFNNQWAILEDNRQDEEIQVEHQAIEMLFDHFDQLPLQGGYVTAGGRVVAFSFGSPINEEVFDTNVEKGLYEVNGSYNIINREMARQVCQNYRLINREDDVGSEGLRKAKLSYNPVLLETKYRAVFKG